LVRDFLNSGEIKFLRKLGLENSLMDEVVRIWRMERPLKQNYLNHMIACGFIIAELLLIKINWPSFIFSSDFMIFFAHGTVFAVSLSFAIIGIRKMMTATSGNREMLFSHEAIMGSFKSLWINVLRLFAYLSIAAMCVYDGFGFFANMFIVCCLWVGTTEAILKYQVEEEFGRTESEDPFQLGLDPYLHKNL
jgi:hypothetical protein